MRHAFTGFFLLTMLHPANAQDALIDRGRTIVNQRCGQCHAVGREGKSRHPTAPVFRRLEARVDLDAFEQRLHNGIVAGHPEMPLFLIKRSETRAIIAYLKSLRADR